jgi:hypothetical protein
VSRRSARILRQHVYRELRGPRDESCGPSKAADVVASRSRTARPVLATRASQEEHGYPARARPSTRFLLRAGAPTLPVVARASNRSTLNRAEPLAAALAVSDSRTLAGPRTLNESVLGRSAPPRRLVPRAERRSSRPSRRGTRSQPPRRPSQTRVATTSIIDIDRVDGADGTLVCAEPDDRVADRFDRINPSLSHPSSLARLQARHAARRPARRPSSPKSEARSRSPRRNTATLRSPAAPAQPPALFRIARARLPPPPDEQNTNANVPHRKRLPALEYRASPAHNGRSRSGAGASPLPGALRHSPFRRESPCPGFQG